jgi:resuscitation-promoting factor RpfA
MSVPQRNATARRWLPVTAAALGTVMAAAGLLSDPPATSSGVSRNPVAWCDRSTTRVDNAGTGFSGEPLSVLTASIASWPACDTYPPDGGAPQVRELTFVAEVAGMTPPAVFPQPGKLAAWAASAKQSQPAAGPQASGQSTTTYSVRFGDCLSDIATSHNIADWQQLYAVNRRGISNPDLIYPGQLLRLPRTRAPQQAPSITATPLHR